MKSFIHKTIAALGLMLACFAFSAGNVNVQAAPTTLAPRAVSVAQAQAIFREMAAQRDIAFRYVKDGCYARAHLMIQRMQARGYQPLRAWAFGNGENLHVKTKIEPSGYVEWWYHVAPCLIVNDRGKLVYMVIDPSVFTRAVTLTEWINVQRRTSASRPSSQVTNLGVAPINPKTNHRDGSGYWPGGDPLGGATFHATTTMMKYKALEPKI